tara:strand:+ start:248 stop:499 length:252 start_codon:yes stop_codon:yes gene_type:complete
MIKEAKFQIGKNGLTKGVLESLELKFKTNKQVRISVLKSATPNKEKIREMAETISKSLPGKYKARILGFTIILRKQTKTSNNI